MSKAEYVPINYQVDAVDMGADPPNVPDDRPTRARCDDITTTGRAFLEAYVAASVSDEEGLLAAVDQREWSAMWKRVDDAAQAFGRALRPSSS